MRYTDPSGHYSEEEILSFFNLKTWKDFLLLFERGGQLDGKWGFIEVLRRARDGDTLTYGDNQEYTATFRRGLLGTGDTVATLRAFGMTHDGVFTLSRHYNWTDTYGRRGESDVELLRTDARTKHEAWRVHTSDMDKLGVALDLASIVVDGLTAGTAGRALNAGQTTLRLARAADALTVISVGYGVNQTGDPLTISEGRYLTGGIMLDIAGAYIPFIPDILSIWNEVEYRSGYGP